MSKVSEESPEEFLTCILRRLDELTSRGVKFHVDTIEGELPLEELEYTLYTNHRSHYF